MLLQDSFAPFCINKLLLCYWGIYIFGENRSCQGQQLHLAEFLFPQKPHHWSLQRADVEWEHLWPLRLIAFSNSSPTSELWWPSEDQWQIIRHLVAGFLPSCPISWGYLKLVLNLYPESPKGLLMESLLSPLSLSSSLFLNRPFSPSAPQIYSWATPREASQLHSPTAVVHYVFCDSSDSAVIGIM